MSQLAKDLIVAGVIFVLVMIVARIEQRRLDRRQPPYRREW